MSCSLRSRFLCCIPLLAGCSVIGAICSLAGISLLFYTLFTLPINNLLNLKDFYFTKYTFFLATLSIYYVGLIFAGCLAVYGALRRSHTKMFPLLAALIAHPFMFFSYKYVYFNDLNIDHFNKYEYMAPKFFETYGLYIFIIGAIVAAYFTFCIINGIEMIKTEYGERLADASEEKKSTLTEFLENYSFVLFVIGTILVCFLVLSTLVGVDMLQSMIDQNYKIQRNREERPSTDNYWNRFTSSTENYWNWFTTSTGDYTTTEPKDYYTTTTTGSPTTEYFYDIDS